MLKRSFSSLLFPYYLVKEYLKFTKSVRVLVYHSISQPVPGDRLGLRISPKDFRRQMQWLRDWGYNVLSLESLFSGAVIKANSVALTFDDGYLDFLDNALPVLQEFGYPAALFVTVDYLNGGKHEITENYWDAWNKINWQAIKKIKDNRLLIIGSHGFSHRRLNQLTIEETRHEITASKEDLENKLGFSLSLFAYPHGVYGGHCFQALREAGYRAAFTGTPGVVRKSTGCFAIPRTEISNYHVSPLEFRKRINGSYDWTSLKKKSNTFLS